MTIAELRRVLEQVEEQEGCGPDTVIHLNDTGSCFLEEPVLGVAMQATEPVLLIQSAHATDLARSYYRACRDSSSSLRLGHPTRRGHLLDTRPPIPTPASPSCSRQDEALLVGA